MGWRKSSGNPPPATEGIREMTRTQDIRDAVERELIYDPLVDASDITVKNINGDVALNGTVPSYPQYQAAAAAARRVAGVKDVHNHLEVALPPADYRDDATLTTTANNALALDITVPDGVEAMAKNGNLTLTGTVGYGSEMTAAERTVAALTGVRGIRDDIEISNDADPVDVEVHVQEALDRYALIPDDSDVTVTTDGSTATLSGHVRTWAEHDAVVDAAWRAIGVYDVLDNLSVTG
jgi:osmotically-inducible protein OsmY